MVRSIAAAILATSALVLVAGCGSSQLSAPSHKATNSLPAQDHQANLDNVALCFHQAVTVLQAEPDTPKDIAIFMKKGKTAVDKSGSESGNADFNALRWNSDGTSLITRTGEPIHCRVKRQTHDNYGPQGSELITEYEFYVSDSNQTSRTTIQLAMRD